MQTVPWYRQFWPWFLLALPATSVAAGIAVIVIAGADPDGLVVDDYYRAGLAINQNRARRREAVRLGLSAQLDIDAAGAVRLTLQPPRAGGEPLSLRLMHPTRAHQDRQTLLLRGPNRRYVGTLMRPAGGRWRVLAEPADGAWRLSGWLTLPATAVRLTPG